MKKLFTGVLTALVMPIVLTLSLLSNYAFSQTSGDGESAITLTLSPDGSAAVTEGTEITATWSDENIATWNVKYKWYASEADAQKDAFTSETGAFADGQEIYGEDNKPVATQAKPVLAIGIADPADEDWVGYWLVKPIVVSYTVNAGSADEGVKLAFDPAGNYIPNAVVTSTVTILEGTSVTITPSDNAEGDIYYVFSGSSMEAGVWLEKAQDGDFSKVGKYDPARKPKIPYEVEGGEDGLCVLAAMFHGKDGKWSKMFTANYEVTSAFEIPVPVFFPEPGEYADSVYVTITSANPALDIVYGSGYDPVLAPDKDYYPKDSAGFKGILVKKSYNFYARTIDQRTANSTWEYSELVKARYTIVDVPMPRFSQKAGAVEAGTKVTISAVEDASVYYTTNGDEPTKESAAYAEGAEITIDAAMTLKAIAVKTVSKEGTETEVTSNVAVAEYTIKQAEADLVFTFNPAAGEVNDNTTVEVSNNKDKEFSFRTYATLKEAQEEPAYVFAMESLEYNETVKPSIKAEKPVLKVGVREGKKWAFFYAEYTVIASLPALVFDPADGAEVEEGTPVTISYSTNDHGLPEEDNIVYSLHASREEAEAAEWDYTAETPIFHFYDASEAPEIVAGKTVIKAAYFVNDEEFSDFFYASYTIKGGEVVEPDTLPVPVFSVAAGEVVKGTTVTLSCDTADAKIYYSVNADTVTVNSLEYTGAIAIDSAMTIRAIAVKEGFVNSAVATAAYTLKETSNDAQELAGVRLYPNPTEGNFKVEVPVAARVEIFASNGVVVNAFTMNAGVEEIRLENSGIYFVRIVAENGLRTVKRVVVR